MYVQIFSSTHVLIQYPSVSGNIKISDFGLCSVFKLNGKERSLSGRCGSLPYIAPEVCHRINSFGHK